MKAIKGSRRNVLGVNISVIDLPRAVEAIISAARGREPLGVSALAVHGLMIAFRDPEFRYRLNDIEMVVPDGQPIRWALNTLYDSDLQDRVPGPDLMHALCELAAAEGLPVFLYGSTPETLSSLTSKLQADFPNLRLTGVRPSRFRSATEQEHKEDLGEIVASGAALTFVGLGCPRQEIWTYENREALSMPVVAVGAAFDYHAGLLKRAPAWMGRAGLEWTYRLLQEPRRLAGRYFRLNPTFLALLALQKMGLRDFSKMVGVKPKRPSRPS